MSSSAWSVREQNGGIVRLADIADVVLGAEDYDTEVRFSGQTAVFMGIWVLPNANSLDVIKRVRTEMAAIQRELPSGMQARVAYDATKYINNAIHEVLKTLGETLLIVMVVIFLFLGSFRSVLVPVVAIPVSLIGAVFLMQVFGFTVNLLTLLAIVLSVGLVVDDAIVVVENVERHLREGQIAPRGGAARRARAGRADHRHDHHPGGGLRAHRPAGRADRRALPRIRLHPGRRGLHLRHRGPDPVAGDVVHSCCKPGIEEHGLAGRITRDFERLRSAYGRLLDATLAARPAVYTVWIVLTLLTVPMFTMSARELAPTEDQGVIFGILDAAANATLEQNSRFAAAVNQVFMSVPETDFTFQITFPSAGFGGMVVKPWDERKRNVFQIMPEVQQKLQAIPGIRMFPVTPPALPGGGQFPVEFVIASTAETERDPRVRQAAAAEGDEERHVRLPAAHRREDRSAQDRDRHRPRQGGRPGPQPAAGRRRPGGMVGGNFVNRFDIAGRSYKVIPQIERVGRLNPDQLKDIYVTGPNGKLIPLSTIATLKESVEPRSLNRFQQLNAVKISGVAMRPLDEALRFLEDEAGKILPKGYGSTTPASRASCAPRGTSSCPPSAWPSS